MRFVNLLIKPASSLCNLRCKYCFYEDEAVNRSRHSMGVMQEEVADTLITQVFEAVDSEGMVSFSFQGGEPTMAGLAFFQNFVAKVKESCPPKVHVNYAIQTNGTLLNEDWAKFLKEENFLVGISLDGFRDAHDAHRLDAKGESTWKKVLAAKSLLEKYKVEYNALCVVTGRCASHPEQAYKTLKTLGFQHIQFIACLDPIGHERGREPWSLTPDAYGRFLCRVFDLWYQDWAAGDYHSVRLFDDYIHILLGDGASTCSTCGKCGSYLVIEADGSGYPCDFFALDEWKIGSIPHMTVAQMLESEKTTDFLNWGKQKPKECGACPHGRICNGGCKNDWFTDALGTHNYFCSAFQTFLGYALPRMQQIARAELAARRRSR